MSVYVAVSFSREHEPKVVGVAATPEMARELVEEFRREPLSLDEHGSLNNFPADGIPDMVGFVKAFQVAGAKE